MSEDNVPIAGATDEEDARARTFVGSLKWTTARTVPTDPHAYVMRDWVKDQPTFDWFLDLVKRYGHRDEFSADPSGELRHVSGTRWVYLHLDGFRYWVSRAWHGGDGPMLNRARSGPHEGPAQQRMEIDHR